MWKKARIKAERVVGECIAQIVEEAPALQLPGAIKVDRIVATLTNIVHHLFPGKVVLQGFIHKQIFWVDSTNTVRHIAQDVPFCTACEIPAAAPGQLVELFLQDVFTDFQLANGFLCEKVVAHVLVKVSVLEQLDVITGQCGVFSSGPAPGQTVFQFFGCDP
jgi:hypothetical protein